MSRLLDPLVARLLIRKKVLICPRFLFFILILCSKKSKNGIRINRGELGVDLRPFEVMREVVFGLRMLEFFTTNRCRRSVLSRNLQMVMGMGANSMVSELGTWKPKVVSISKLRKGMPISVSVLTLLKRFCSTRIPVTGFVRFGILV